MRKPAFCIRAKAQAQISCAVTAHLISAFVFAAKCNPSSQIRNFKPLVIFGGYTARFESDPVGNPDDRFSRVAAHI